MVSVSNHSLNMNNSKSEMHQRPIYSNKGPFNEGASSPPNLYKLSGNCLVIFRTIINVQHYDAGASTF